MKVLVPVKRVLDFNLKVRVKPDGSGVDLSNLKMSINPFPFPSMREMIIYNAARTADPGLIWLRTRVKEQALQHRIARKS